MKGLAIKPVSALILVLFLNVAADAQTTFFTRLADTALTLTKYRVTYDPTYRQIGYPNGDVPENKGVCTDVVIRAYRKMGIDLQVKIHEDMRANFGKYPKTWGLSRPDKNIDHRRVPNLMVFFSRFGTVLPITNRPGDYQPGDIVCWMLPGNLPHIGIVSRIRSRDKKRFLMIHNVGAGQVAEDCLFDYKITGHYRYQ